MREKTCIEAVQVIMDGRLTVAKAAQVLDFSEQQFYRSLAVVSAEGLTGLVHGNRSRQAGTPPRGHAPGVQVFCSFRQVLQSI